MIRIIRQFIIDNLGFTKSEANGTLVLILLILAIGLFPRILYIKGKTSSESFKANPDELSKKADLLDSLFSIGKTPPDKVIKFFTFNPNQASQEDLLQLGFTHQATNNLLKYRANGGRFEIKSDLKKIYGVSDSHFAKISSYIDLPESNPPKIVFRGGNVSTKPKKSPAMIDINAASAIELQVIRGIGPVLSERIIKYRDRLGGFYSEDQLYEVYGLDSAVVRSLQERITVPDSITLISLHTDSVKNLALHPYLDWNTARAIINFQKQHGKFDSVNQLRSIKIISDSLYEKIYPYLSVPE